MTVFNRKHEVKSNFEYLYILVRKEVRVIRRLSRWKLFLWVASLTCLINFVILTWFHMSVSGSSPLLGFLSPRYIGAILGEGFIYLSGLGIVLLAFDAQTRDDKEQIGEVIRTKPFSELVEVISRLLAHVVIVGIPMTSLLILFALYGLFWEYLSIPFGEPIEPRSLFSLLVFDLVPNLVFVCSLTLFLASLAKSRLLVLFISLLCFTGIFWINNRLPLPLADLFQTVSGNVIIPSELTTTLVTPQTLFNRIVLLLVSSSFILAACTLSRRNVDERNTYWFGSIGSVGLAVVVSVVVLGSHMWDRSQIARWIEFHTAHFETVIIPNVHHVGGSVDLRPGRTMFLDLTLQVSIPADVVERDVVAFSFNPGFNITNIEVAGEVVKGEEFRHGLLKIPRKYFSLNSVNLQIRARGRPDRRFAYLDTVRRVSSVAGPNVGQLRLLGTKNAIFRSEFVVLVPGIKWYPTAGTATQESISAHRQKNFFTLDLEVAAPKGWLIAGPTQGQTKVQSRRQILSFRTSKSIPEFALGGSKFELGQMEINGINFELLYRRVHRQSIEQFRPFLTNVRTRVLSLLDSIENSGFEFLNENVGLVVVPSSLRVFGGGDRMDSVMFPPGMILIRENTFPTLHVHSLLPPDQVRSTSNLDVPAYARALAEYFTKQPMYESNFLHYLKNITSHRTSAKNKNAPLLNTAIETIVPELLMDSEAYFDFDVAINRSVIDVKEFTLFDLLNRYFLWKESFRTVVDRRERLLTTSSIFNAIETNAAVESAEVSHPGTLQRALRLRAIALNQLLIDTYGEQAVGHCLYELIQQHRGENFVYTDFLDVLRANGLDGLNELDDWISSSRLPGFDASLYSNIELVDQETDFPLYEVVVHISNEEPVNGTVQVWIENWGSSRFSSAKKFPIFVKGESTKEVVLRSTRVIKSIWIEPYLSLNRSNLRVSVPFERPIPNQKQSSRRRTYIHAITEVKSDATSESNGFQEGSIIVDDLDAGFSVLKNQNRLPTVIDWTKMFLGSREPELDGGLPVYEVIPIFPSEGKWERKTDPTAHGKYRRTFAISRAKTAHRQVFVKFSAELPITGTWQLDYFYPEGYFIDFFDHQGIKRLSRFDQRLGPIDLVIESENQSIAERFNPRASEFGWLTVGSYDLTHRDVSVLVSNIPLPDFDAVIADAIRWTPIDTTP